MSHDDFFESPAQNRETASADSSSLHNTYLHHSSTTATPGSHQSSPSVPVVSEEQRYRIIEWNKTQKTYTCFIEPSSPIPVSLQNHSEQSPTNEEESPLLYINYGKTRYEYRRHVLLHELIELQAIQTPDAIAVISDELQITYAILMHQANRLARYLQTHGVVPDQLVGVCLDRSLEMIIGLLGVLKAGGAYVPLDPSYPQERLAFMLRDAHVSILLTQQRFVSLLPENEAKLLCLDHEQWIEEGGTPIHSTVTGDHLAYVIYTSGSTGTPKGAMNSHRAICNRLLWMQETYHLTATDRVLQKTPFSFDVSVWEFFWPLMMGACLVFAQPDGHRDPGYLVQLIQEQQITTMHFVPSMLHVFLEHPAVAGCLSLYQVICSGEALPYSLQERFFSLLPAQLHNLYGPTEAAIDVTAWTCERSSNNHKVPIGRPIANIETYILDQSLQLLPIGEVGELYISGIGLARGYLRRPDLTAERFIPHPFSATPDARLYKTGDLARYLPDGEIEFLGRLDNQVKLHGFRIELGEIEDVLTRHPSVREAVVVLRTNTAYDMYLVGYVVASSSTHSVSVVELRETIRKHLPDYMIPSQIVFLPSMPLTTNGKVDRGALPIPQSLQARSQRSSLQPRDALERFLATCWQKALNIKQIGIDEHFFDLGGNSIKAAIVINAVQEKLETLIHVVALFDASTIADLSAYLRTRYTHAVAQAFPELSLHTGISSANEVKKIGPTHIKTFRDLIPPLLPLPHEYISQHKNPPAIFVLSPPRSGTTLLRVMLGGHPRIFSPPDLELLPFNTLQERKGNFTTRDSSWLEGTIRAIMELRNCDGDEAKRIMAQFEEQNLTIQEFYGVLQTWIGEKTLVDKSVEYALDIETLRRSEDYFTDARYIHLIRHPYGMIQSMEDVRLEQVYFRHQHPFTPRELAELVWLVCHQNILQFLQEIPTHRHKRVYFEDLVKQPEATIRQLCNFLSLDFSPDMLEPHKGRRMTNGIYTVSRMLGDMKFHEHKQIDAMVADRWKDRYQEDFLSDETWQLTEKLGYSRFVPQTTKQSIATTEQYTSSANSNQFRPRPILRTGGIVLPLSFAQQSLWFLAQLVTDSPFYVIPMAFHMKGPLSLSAITRSLQEIVRRHEVLRTSFTAVQGIPAQIIAEAAQAQSLSVPVIDLGALSEDKSEEAIHYLLRSEARRPFALDKDLMLRATIIRLRLDSHILLLTLHHIAADGWSQSILQHELSTLYVAFVKEQPSSLPKLPLHYADYALWQRQSLTETILQQQLAYWQQQLADLPILHLPTDYPRPVVEAFQGARSNFELPLVLLTQLKELSQHQGVTLFMTLCAAFQVLLARYSGQDDIAVGTSIAHRRQQDLEELIGFFMNTFVLRGNLSGDPTFIELLARVYHTALAAYAHQDVPFEQVVSAIQPDRDSSHSTLYQVLFQLQHQNQHSLHIPDLSISNLDVDNGTAKCDLFLDLVESENGFKGRIEYNTDIFARERIERMQAHFQHLLEAIVSTPQQRISQLWFLEEDESRQILVEWNNTHTAYPREACIQTLVEMQTKRTPEAIALVAGDEHITYTQINQRANQLARVLQKQGVRPDTCIGLCLEQTPDLIIALLAILKAGGAYLPLDPSYPVERLAFMLEDAQVPILITQRRFLPILPTLDVRVICLDRDAEKNAIAQESNTNLPLMTVTHNLAYVIYTSGSTGIPKGVSVVHQAVVRLVCQTNYINFHADDVIAQASTVAFDAATFEIWGALIHGARLVLLEKDVVLSPYTLDQQIRQERISVLFLTTAVFHQIAQHLPTTFAPLRYLLFGGESVDVRQVRAVTNHSAPQHLLHVYGPTESTTYATWYPVHEVTEHATTIPIGSALANTQVYIMDDNLQPVPPGVPGELFIGGDGLARGYLHRPALTAETFIPHPFSELPGQRLYRTGDIVRWRLDGQIEFVGRRDSQVKIRGLRIELGEIETVLARHPDVGQVLILVRQNQEQTKHLVAYIKLRDSQHSESSQATLRQYLREHLPEYMLPTSFVFLDQFPLNRNGKIDRQALPQPEQSVNLKEPAKALPRDNVEQMLATIWRQILNIEQIGIHDNFFTLGGDSILSIQMVARAHQGGLQLTPRQIFLHPTIAELAGSVDITPSIIAEQEPISGDMPLTPIQHWFFTQALSIPHHFNQAMLLEIRRQVSPMLLKQAFYQLMKHHDALRMRFSQPSPGQWQQMNAGIERLENIPFEQIDLSMTLPQEREAAFLNIADKAQGSLDLAHGPILRVLFITTGGTEPDRLLIIIHHLVVDSISWRILIEDLERVCEQLLREQSVQLPSKTLSFRQWALHLMHHVQKTKFDSAEQYWLQELQQPYPSLPLDFPHGYSRQDNTFAQARTVTVTLEQQSTHALLHQLPSIYHTQINDVLLTALAQTLTAWMDTTNILITLEGHGREELFTAVDLTRTVGWFTSLFPIRLDLTKISDPIAALQAIKEQLQRIPDRGFSYGLLRYLYRAGPIQSERLPIPQISFNYLGQFDQMFAPGSLFAPVGANETYGTIVNPDTPRSHLLQINARVQNNCMHISWTYGSRFNRKDTIEALARRYLAALKTLIARANEQAAQSISYTPADFPNARISQEQLHTLFSKIGQAQRKDPK